MSRDEGDARDRPPPASSPARTATGVVDDDMRAEITGRVTDRLHHRDLDRLLDRTATCEAIADYLAAWYVRSARPPGHARLVAVTVTTGAGDHGEINLTAGGLR